jgi:hypothetical protein
MYEPADAGPQERYTATNAALRYGPEAFVQNSPMRSDAYNGRPR